MELKFTESNFTEEVLNSDVPVVVDFYADWCGPCKMMAPVISQMAEQFAGKCKVGKCNIDDNMELAQKYRVMTIPTIIVFKNGEAADTSIGVISGKELADKIANLL